MTTQANLDQSILKSFLWSFYKMLGVDELWKSILKHETWKIKLKLQKT